MVHIKVPATTANMGPGFDCIGMALKLYNNLWAEKTEEQLVIENRGAIGVPVTKSNMIYRSIARFYSELGLGDVPGVKLIQDDNIPMTRGLGSSAACVVAGLLAANELSGVNLPREQICALAARIEGHPDNSTPALVGGIVIGAFSNNHLEYIKLTSDRFSGLKFAVMIPDFLLPTKKARDALPKKVAIEDAVFNTARGALMTAALLTGDYSKLGAAMDDKLHQPYRARLIPGMKKIFTAARKCGASGVFLSGAGPSIIAVYTNDTFTDEMRQYIEALPGKWDMQLIEPDDSGAIVTVT